LRKTLYASFLILHIAFGLNLIHHCLATRSNPASSTVWVTPSIIIKHRHCLDETRTYVFFPFPSPSLSSSSLCCIWSWVSYLCERRRMCGLDTHSVCTMSRLIPVFDLNIILIYAVVSARWQSTRRVIVNTSTSASAHSNALLSSSRPATVTGRGVRIPDSDPQQSWMNLFRQKAAHEQRKKHTTNPKIINQ